MRRIGIGVFGVTSISKLSQIRVCGLVCLRLMGLRATSISTLTYFTRYTRLNSTFYLFWRMVRKPLFQTVIVGGFLFEKGVLGEKALHNLFDNL